MVEYATISKMIEFQQAGYWPLEKFCGKKGNIIFLKLKDIIRILLNKGPVKSTHFNNVVNVPLEVFRMGTRGWEYPWIIENLTKSVPKGAKVLDCGCGVNGFPLELFRLGYKAYGLDYFVGKDFKRKGYGLPDKYIKKYSSKIKFLNGGMESIPSQDSAFDAITCISVMEHVVIDHKQNPSFHFQCLTEMHRVLKPGGLLLCTYDTILNKDVVYANKFGWGKNGWYYKDDIEYLLNLGMQLIENKKIPEREEILMDENVFFIPPDFYFAYGYGSGFEDFGKYHRLTSVGFILRK